MAKILLVDDDPDLAEACRMVLEKHGHEFSWAPSKDKGMAQVKKQEPELLILDVMMDEPDDGFRMARELRAESRKFPILMLSSVSKVLGTEYGVNEEMVPVDEFIEKPVQPDVLLKKVKELLESRKRK